VKVLEAKSSKGSVPRREQMWKQRARSDAMHKGFPEIERLRIELVFFYGDGLPLSPQVHTLYPAATAFFRFACPCADCDGDFNLTEAVSALARNGTLVAQGQLICDGARRNRRLEIVACSVRLNYELTTSSAKTLTSRAGT
jgi:hypothetical protein